MQSITVFGSSVCNFDCSFCFLHKNTAYASYNALIKEAWENGEYVKNLEKTMRKLKADPLEVKEMQIWGGESLLGIDGITKNLTNIYEIFPNINDWLLSSNFSVKIDSLINFIVELDKIADRSVTFKLQLSIDGPPGEISENGHNGWSKYEENIDKLTNYFNNYKLKWVHVNILIHPTVAKEHYFKFIDYEYLKNYMIFMYDFGKKIQNKCISKYLFFTQEIIYPNIATPYEFTVEDGRNFRKVFEVWDQVYRDYFEEKGLANEGFFSGIGLFSRIKNINSPNTECRELHGAITINYDGSIVECSGSFIDYYEPYLKELQEKNEIDLYLVSKSHNQMTSYFPNESSVEQLEDKKWYVHDGGYRNTKAVYLASTVNAANALAHAGQISIKYIDNYDLLLRHCSLILNCTSCSRNNIAETHMPYVLPIGALRLYLNGAAEYIYDYIKNNYSQVLIARSKT